MKQFFIQIHFVGGNVMDFFDVDEELKDKIADFAVMGSDDKLSPDWLIFVYKDTEYNLNRKLICAVTNCDMEV
ncbi:MULTISPECIES: hypothetical protein [Paenibacillus]|uniref:hypothetical protein n=1 Tax=Paenibacillus TaxID=44249 RepID=UPI00030E4EA9|nr:MULTISPECIES: hypothetical protein [Paenibacillus]